MTHSSRRRLLGTTTLALGAALLAAPLAAPLAAIADTPVERLVLALDPPAGDTNLFWASSGDQSLYLTLSPLVGNDSETGAYDNSGLAESWEHNDDYTTWTFHLRQGVPWFQVYFEDIGLQTEIREMDWASLRALGLGRQAYVINPIRNAPIRPTEVHMLNVYVQGGSPFNGFEDDHIQGLIDQLTRTFNPEERDKIAAEAFTYVFEQYSDMPIAAVRAQVTVNPEVVGGWEFPGVTTTGMSHWHQIEPAS